MANTEFERIYQLYFGQVYGYVLKMCQNESIAEEVTSDTFFKAMKSMDRFRGECNVSSWLCQIAKNTYVTYLRKNKLFDPFHDLEDAKDASMNIEEMVIAKNTTNDIYKVVHILEEPYKEVFMLRVFGELGFKKIGELFGKSENWACVTYHRAKRKIQEKMEGWE